SQQLDDFWDDLDRLDSKQKHYTGQLTLDKVPKESWEKWDKDTWFQKLRIGRVPRPIHTN
ncbi:MAG: hypothetical protein ACREQX_10765, partial [Candidatus Binataceae bacterium]